MRLFINLTPFTLPRRAYPPLHDMDIYSYLEGESFREGASPPLLSVTPPSLVREGG